MSTSTVGRDGRPVDTSNPSYYRSDGVECIDYIRKELGDIAFIGFCRGNAIKYKWRSGLKGNASACIAKAKWYDQMADHVASDGTAPDPRDRREP